LVSVVGNYVRYVLVRRMLVMVMPAAGLFRLGGYCAPALLRMAAVGNAAKGVGVRVPREPASARNEKGVGKVQADEGPGDDSEGNAVHGTSLIMTLPAGQSIALQLH
jgi:hypothetical protein